MMMVVAAKTSLLKEFAFFETSSRLFQFLELNSWRPHPSLERVRKICHCVFMSSLKGPIGKFHVLVKQRRHRNVPKSAMYMQNCCFGY